MANNKELRKTLRFVTLIAIPLCLVNSLIFSWGEPDLLTNWATRFVRNLLITFPQAVVYVSAIKWFDNRGAQKRMDKV